MSDVNGGPVFQLGDEQLEILPQILDELQPNGGIAARYPSGLAAVHWKDLLLWVCCIAIMIPLCMELLFGIW